MQNKPQLTAEIEKRFSKIMLEWIESQWKIEQAHQNGEPYTRMKFEADANKVEKKLKHFLATALEEQKQGYEKWANEKIAKCERLKESNFVNESPDYFRGKIAILNDLLAILNGKEANE